ncbi:PPE domain-containing protein [Amycolatopsis sp. NPDC026612]|uniref:PPE domain-containing protein n=1 Tax=Amycolatopsis sp. NPDC026612 TaxID=3155466 RepID=UPI003400EC74
MVTEGPLTATQIYEQITSGKGTPSLEAAQVGASQLTSRMVERAQRINALRAKTMSGWRGDAGDSAADATRPLVQAAADDAVHLKNAQTAVGAQMDAFGTAKNSVKPVPPEPPELGTDDVLNVLTGKGWDSYNTKVAGWQADSQANIDAFGAYHSASTANGGQMPAQYAQLADSGAPVSLSETADTRSTTNTDAGWTRNPRQPRLTAQDRQTGRDQVAKQETRNVTDQTRDPLTNRPQTPSQFQNQGRLPGSTDNTGNTHANSYVPKPVVPPAAQGGYEFGPTGQPVRNLTGTGTNWPGIGGFGPGTGTEYRPGTVTGTGTGTGAGTGTGTGTGIGTGTGTGRNTGIGPGGRSDQPGVRGPGNGTGARLPEERFPGANSARGSAGPRGANGTPMGAPMNGRGGKEEDREKKRAAYLRNPDPDETFGGFIEKPMPPVIGENRAKKQ